MLSDRHPACRQFAKFTGISVTALIVLAIAVPTRATYSIAAVDQCRAGLKISPEDVRLKFRMARLQQKPQVTP